ncbi:MAG: DUF3109 family protein [Balneolaceae bacterium]|nr:MAG: DUF3109 family protein [Balneolaceae bacterium]
MIRVDDVILSDDIATAKFACDITRCKGACCVVGDAGAPVSSAEIPVLRKAFHQLKESLNPEAVEAAAKGGIIQGDSTSGYEITCIASGECIFVLRDENGAAVCAIQKAFYEGRFDWEKPVSCHLYPVRLKHIAGFDYANFEYIPSLCSAGCERGEKEGIWLSDFLRAALVRRYGEEWYESFLLRCESFRNEVIE